MQQGLSFETSLFRLEPLAEGVYAAVAKPGGGSSANAGIIDLGDRTLVYDTFQTPQAAVELKRAAEELTGRPVSLVVNSHFHADHTFGNQVFEGAAIMATAKTREVLADQGERTIRAYIEQGPGYLADQEQRLAEMTDPVEREDFAEDVAQTRELVKAAPTLKLVLPHVLIEERLVITGTKRRVELLVHQGHTFSDIVCWLPEEQICFTGDLVAVANHPWIGHGTPEGWLQTCDRLEALGIERLVPGHGEPAGPEWIEAIRRYLKAVMACAEEKAAGGSTAEQVAAMAPFAPYDRWEARQVFGWNISFLVGRLEEHKGE